MSVGWCKIPATLMILPRLVIEDDILPALVAYCREKHHTLFMLVCDNNTYRALGRRVEQGLRAQGWDVLTAKLEGAEVIADEDHIIQVLLQHDGLPRTYLAVGSGTITDIARFASHRSGRPFLIPANGCLGGRFHLDRCAAGCARVEGYDHLPGAGSLVC